MIQLPVTISVTLTKEDYYALIGVLSRASNHDPKLVGLADHMVALANSVAPTPEVEVAAAPEVEKITWTKAEILSLIGSYVDCDLEDAVERAVRDYFDCSFSLDDHCDIASEVASWCEEFAPEAINEKVEEEVTEKFNNITVSFG